MNQEELDAKIDAFLWDFLPDVDRELIEKEIENNPDFRSKVAIRQFEHRLMERMERESLAAKMTAWEAEANIAEKKTPDVVVEPPPMMTPVYVKRRFLSRSLQRAMAAGFALLVTVGGSYFWAKGNYDRATVAKGYYADERLEKIDIPRTTGGIKDEAVWTKERIDYEDYLKNTEGVVQDNNTRQKVEWKLVTLYVLSGKMENNPMFTDLLNKIIQDPRHLFHKEALELNQKMNSFWWQWVN